VNVINKVSSDFIKSLLQLVPELHKLYDEHIVDYGELLPHVFLGDVTRFFVQEIRKGAMDKDGPAGRILDFIEDDLKKDEIEIQELISFSFVENIAKDEDIILRLNNLLGPNMKKEINAVGVQVEKYRGRSHLSI